MEPRAVIFLQILDKLGFLLYNSKKSGGDSVDDKEILNVLMDKYFDLQRILAADDREQEIEYQLKLVTAKLESMGVVTADLNIVKK